MIPLSVDEFQRELFHVRGPGAIIKVVASYATGSINSFPVRGKVGNSAPTKTKSFFSAGMMVGAPVTSR